jgi:hypothetical protein
MKLDADDSLTTYESALDLVRVLIFGRPELLAVMPAA